MCIMPVGEGAIRVTTEGAGADIALPADGKGRGHSTRLPTLPRPAAIAGWVWRESAAQLDRVFLWTPVAFGAGAAAYLGCKAEPSLWLPASLALLLGLCAALVLRWGHSRALSALLVLAAMTAAGFAAAKLRSDHVAAPIAPAGLGVVRVEGWVVDIDNPSDNRPRLVLAPTAVGRLSATELPLRVRVLTPPGEPPPPGTAVRLEALIDPPPAPAAPGAYDFARDAWFHGEGGVGLARGPAEMIALPAPGWRLRAVMALAAFRWRMAERVAYDMDQAMGGRAGDAAGLAAAVTTSHQDWLSDGARDALRASGLAHMLAIAGLHTAAVGGFVFFALRLGVASWPWLALRASGKKIAAAGGLVAVVAYLVLSGAHPPARRAAITASAAFIAILLGRRAISLRSLALAALIILVTEPEVVVEPGFEMSFCATASLVALAEMWPRTPRPAGMSWPVAWLLRGRDWLAGLFAVSLVAGAATGPFAIQHFNRIANYSVPANLTADFLAGAVMMPALAAALPLEAAGSGLGGPLLFVAGWAAKAILGLANVFSTAPGAALWMSAAPTLVLAMSYLGIVFVCLWDGRLRWIGLPFAAAVAVWPRGSTPAVWVAGDGADAAMAVGGKEIVLRPGIRGYATDLWAQRRGLAVPTDGGEARSALFDCDYWSCAARPGVEPALGIWWTRRRPKAERLSELCARSEVLVLRAEITPPRSCDGVLVLKPSDFAAGSAAELYPAKSGWRIVWSQPLRGERPWTGTR
jgi:competence protein ComEC